jgi:hypothetical protein
MSNFYTLASLTNLNTCNTELKSLLYLISGNNDLFAKKDYIYNFYDNHLSFKGFNYINTDFCYSSKALIRLAINLFNGFSDKYTDPFNLLAYLDTNNYMLAINSINIRFNYF